MYYFEQTVIMLRLISLENGIQYSKTKACKALSSLWMRQLTARGRISCLCFTSAAIRWITNLSLLPTNINVSAWPILSLTDFLVITFLKTIVLLFFSMTQ